MQFSCTVYVCMHVRSYVCMWDMLMPYSQLGIPEQVEEVEWLSFSPVEEHFYQRQQDKSLQEAQRVERHAQQY